MQKSLGQIAYEAWASDRNYVGVFSELPSDIQSAWEAAADAVTAALLGEGKLPAART